MFDWIDLIVAVIVGAAGRDIIRTAKDRIARPYRFTCPEVDCFFKAAANEKDLMSKVVTDHAIRFHALDDQS